MVLKKAQYEGRVGYLGHPFAESAVCVSMIPLCWLLGTSVQKSEQSVQ
jgi:hypothetical protein